MHDPIFAFRRAFRLAFLSGCLALGATVRAAPPAALDDALKTGADEFDHWAYTETTWETDLKGHDGPITVYRFDPSKPDPEQFTPITVDGHPPRPDDLKKYRERGIKRGERLAKDAERAGHAPAKVGARPDDASITINGDSATLALDQAQLLSENASALTYLIPLHAPKSHGLPVQKLRVTISVTRAPHLLRSASLAVTAPFRVMVVGKVRAGQLSAVWTVVDPRYTPVLTSLDGNASGSILFVHLAGSIHQHRSNFVHVTPYSDRFGVRIGPMKVLPF